MIHSNILIIGESGAGKSYSIQHLPPETTGILNLEMKGLPFSSERAKLFQDNIECPDLNVFQQAFTYLMNKPTINIIVIDSLSMYFDLAELAGVSLVSSADTRGQWRVFGAQSKIFLRQLQLCGKLIIAIGHQEWLNSPSEDPTQMGMISQRRFKINGKMLEGKVESSFTIVLGARARTDKGKPYDPIFEFTTRTDGISPCKCPIDMRLSAVIPNDLGFVVKEMGRLTGVDYSKPFVEQGIK
jgi:hypothetical protein